jgi:hypothetical protein
MRVTGAFVVVVAMAITGWVSNASAQEVTTGLVSHNWEVFRGKTKVIELTAHSFSRPGVKVQVLCHGKGCPFKVRNVPVRRGQAKAAKLFKRKLRAGLSVSVVFAAPGTIGRFIDFTTRRAAIPAVRSACATFGSTTPTGCVGQQGPPGANGAPGPAGPRGATGPAGPAGLNATALWSVVNSNGTLNRGSHVSSVGHLGAGIYEVIFDRDVSACAYVGAISDTGFGAAFGFFSASKRGGQPRGIFVETASTAGTIADEPFHVAVFC